MPKAKHLEFGEAKKLVGMKLTQTSVQGLDIQAQRLGISRSQFVELIGRGLIPVMPLEERLGKSFAS